MKLLLKRTDKAKDFTLGELYINGKLFCYTCEDTDRGLRQDMPVATIEKIKVKTATCIPYGKYKVTLDVVSPKYSNPKYKWAQKIGAKVPRLIDVPCYEGVLIHVGNYAKDTDGCLLVGFKKAKNGVLDSTNCFLKLYDILLKDKNNIEIEIV